MTVAASPSAGTWASARPLGDPRVVRTLRYAIGSTLAMGLAMGIDWRLSFIAPVLALSFLGSPAPRPTLGTAAAFIAIVTVASLVGVAVSVVLLPYPAVLLLLEALLLYLLFYAGARGAQKLLVSLLLIAVTVIPVVALQSLALAVAVAQGLVAGAAGAVTVVWLSHVLVPDAAPPPSPPRMANEPAPTGETPRGRKTSANAGPGARSRHAAARGALLSTLVVYPVVWLYFVFGLTSVVVLVFVALLSTQPDFASGLRAGKALIVGNVMGGLAAVVMYELLVMVPQFGFLLVLTLLAGLFFGGRLFSGAPAAPLFGMAYSTLILVVGSTTSMYGDANAKAWTRVVQITIAVVYLVVAFGVILRLRHRPEAANGMG